MLGFEVHYTRVSNPLVCMNFRSWSMKTSLVNAFALGPLAGINGFHPSPSSWFTPGCSCWTLPFHQTWISSHWNELPLSLFALLCVPKDALSTLIYSKLLMVYIGLQSVKPPTEYTRCPHPTMQDSGQEVKHGWGWETTFPTTSCSTASSFAYASGGWYYRGCWHQTCPPLVLMWSFRSQSVGLRTTRFHPYCSLLLR